MKTMCSFFISLYLALGAIFGPLAAQAGTITDLAAEAEVLLEKGDGAAALERMEKAMELAWEAAPLTIRKAIYVESATGYGLYVEREAGHSFRPDEKLHIYVEPAGYSYGRDGVGNLALGMVVDLVVLDSKGATTMAKKDFLSFMSPLRYKNREFYLTLNVKLNDFPPGEYTAKFQLRDQYSDKSTTFDLPLIFLK